jgi:8-oxo-dGTP pyrophosphatase MutT (NUDIX family)
MSPGQLPWPALTTAWEARLEPYQRPIVCIIAVDPSAEPLRVLLQRRTKADDDTPYGGCFELPQGKVNRNESLDEAARRELFEETGLELARLICGGESSFHEGGWESSSLYTAHPLICVVDTVQNHLGMAVVAEVRGRCRETAEATQHQWLTLDEISDLISQGTVFPINVPMLEEFFKLSRGARADGDVYSCWREDAGQS